jgi:tetratricopeptide (TPR) repeat protein
MKLIKLTLSLILASTLTFSIAQELPKASPAGKVEQQVGLTNISITYSRPSVKGRKIFGDLVPFGEVWRLGANEATTITVDQYLKFGDQILNPGTYAMFATPHEDGTWDIMFNSDYEQWGTGKYDETKNVVTLMVQVERRKAETETLLISIGDLTLNSGTIVISWAEMYVPIPFKVETKKQAKENIEVALEKGEELDKVHYAAAKYFRNAGDYKTALTHIDKSIKIEDYHGAYFLKARILADSGDKDGAIKMAEKALEVAKEKGADNWFEYIQESIDEWKNS